MAQFKTDTSRSVSVIGGYVPHNRYKQSRGHASVVPFSHPQFDTPYIPHVSHRDAELIE